MSTSLFTTAVVDGRRLVRTALPTVLLEQLALFAAHGLGRRTRDHLTGPGPLATAGTDEQDLFARLEADMASDRILDTLVEQSALAERVAIRVLSTATTADPSSPLHGFSRLQFDTTDGELLLQWLQGVTLQLRQQERNAAGAPDVTIGQPQQAAALFGAPDLEDLNDAAEVDAEVDDAYEPPEATLSMLLTVIVHELQQAVFTDQLAKLTEPDADTFPTD